MRPDRWFSFWILVWRPSNIFHGTERSTDLCFAMNVPHSKPITQWRMLLLTTIFFFLEKESGKKVETIKSRRRLFVDWDDTSTYNCTGMWICHATEMPKCGTEVLKQQSHLGNRLAHFFWNVTEGFGFTLLSRVDSLWSVFVAYVSTSISTSNNAAGLTEVGSSFVDLSFLVGASIPIFIHATSKNELIGNIKWQMLAEFHTTRETNEIHNVELLACRCSF